MESNLSGAKNKAEKTSLHPNDGNKVEKFSSQTNEVNGLQKKDNFLPNQNGVLGIDVILDSDSTRGIPREIVNTSNTFEFTHPPTMNNAAILVERGYKKYGSYTVLNDFNMCVKENTIYGLLGASGCGKTTILSCIVALRSLDSGNIFICGKPTGSRESGVPGRKIGYMPQEIALNLELTVEEVLEYFGRIYGMAEARIKERYNYLMKLLSLEKSKSLIGNLSDGQKRRVSLAVTLIHEPDILILDEPTVGCDPLLRQSIWEFLTDLVTQKRATVIVTTHYIEETRQADKIGFMRNGHLLVEDSPTKLLLRYNVKLLDDIVLKLCQKNEDEENCEFPSFTSSQRSTQNKDDASLLSIDKCNEREMRFVKPVKGLESAAIVNTISSSRLNALLRKNCIIFFRNFWCLLVSLSIPCTSVLICNIALSSEPIGQRIGVINHEMPLFENCKIIEPISCSPTMLSCYYLDSIQEKVNLIPFDSIEAASVEVHKTNIWGFVTFEKDFSRQVFGRLLYGKRTNATIQESQINIKLDMSNKAIGLHLKKVFLDGYHEFSKRLFQSCSIDPLGRELPIIYEEPLFGNEEAAFSDYFTLGIIIAITFFSSAFSCGITYIREKQDGMINRTLVTGVTTLEIMASHVITQIGVGLVQSLLLFVILFAKVSNNGSFLLAFGILFLNILCGIAIGFLSAMFAKEEKIAILIAVGTLFPNTLASGLFWPMEGAPSLLRHFGSILPPSRIGQAFRSTVLRGSTISHHLVWKGALTVSVWICISVIIIVLKTRINFRRN